MVTVMYLQMLRRFAVLTDYSQHCEQSLNTRETHHNITEKENEHIK